MVRRRFVPRNSADQDALSGYSRLSPVCRRCRTSAQQKPLCRRLRLLDAAAKHQPERALHDETTADGDGHREHERAGVYPTPSVDIGVFEQDQEADGRAHQAAHRLETERRQHHPATNAARNAFGNDEVGGRIVAPERDANPYERRDCHRVRRTERQHRREDAEQHHFDNEDLLAAIPVGKPAERRGAD